MTERPLSADLRETRLVACASLALALISLVYCSQHSLLLLYGDAVAHLHIARRVFDSLNPGFRQLGSVWLPLPHLLLLPFVQNMSWWQTGLAGAWVSIPAYVAGSTGIYRLARLWLPVRESLLAFVLFAANPGLLYMATTAMTEPLFLAEMIWSALLLAQFDRAVKGAHPERAGRFLLLAGLVLVAAVYTRYDGWTFAALAWLCVLGRMVKQRRWTDPVGGAFLLFTALLVAAPVLWLAYNAKQFGDPLDFLRGPYSARAIYLRTSPPGSPRHPGYHSLAEAAVYFLKSAELGAAPLHFGKLLVGIVAAGTLAAIFFLRSRPLWPALLLWLPLPFYAYSVAYGSVPIFIPVWHPFSYYNTRYGMELLPAFALFFACFVAAIIRWRPSLAGPLLASAFALLLLDSRALLHARPLVLQEALVNSSTRIAFEDALANSLRALPGDGPILMYTSEHIGAVQQAGIPLRRTINETDYFEWKQALQQPARAAAYIIATQGDAVDQAVQRYPEGLELISVVCSTGQPCARVYSSHLYTGG